MDGATTPDSRKKRSRSGCLTCRRRKVRCDEQHPTCSSCHRLNHACSWPDVSYTTARHAHRRRRVRKSTLVDNNPEDHTVFDTPGLAADDDSSPHGLSSSLTLTADVENPVYLTSGTPWWSSLGEGLLDINWLEHWDLDHNGLFYDPGPPSNLQQESPSAHILQPRPTRNVTLRPQDREVLQHFTSTMVRFCILRNTLHDNLYSYILTNMGLFHSTLLDAMLAWSALHLAHVRHKTNQDAKARYERAYAALLEDLSNDVAPSLVLATIWFLMQFQLILAEGVDGFCDLLNLAADVAKAELQGRDAETSMSRIGPIGSLILVWMSARDSQVAYLGVGGRLLGCLKTYPYIYELVEASSVSDEAYDAPEITFMSREQISARQVPSDMQACMRLSLRHVTLAGQIKILGRRIHHGDSPSAWDSVRTSLRILRKEIEQDDSPAGKAALGVAMGDLAAMPEVDPICYNRLLLLSGYYATLIQYNTVQPDDCNSVEDMGILPPEECANRVIRAAQKVSRERPNSPQGVWPTQLLMAGVTTKDPVYQSWVIGALEQAERWGANYAKSAKLLEAVIKKQNATGEQVNLIETMKETTGLFII